MSFLRPSMRGRARGRGIRAAPVEMPSPLWMSARAVATTDYTAPFEASCSEEGAAKSADLSPSFPNDLSINVDDVGVGLPPLDDGLRDADERGSEVLKRAGMFVESVRACKSLPGTPAGCDLFERGLGFGEGMIAEPASLGGVSESAPSFNGPSLWQRPSRSVSSTSSIGLDDATWALECESLRLELAASRAREAALASVLKKTQAELARVTGQTPPVDVPLAGSSSLQ